MIGYLRAVPIIISDENNWNIIEKRTIQKSDDIYRTVELVGSLRINSPSITHALVKTINYPNRMFGGSPRGFNDCFVSAALVRIGESAIPSLLILSSKNKSILLGPELYFSASLPEESSYAIIRPFL
ncbi:MAG: hypothetical protein LBJ67_13960 [Planctomycetaceae bacterium]|nr:hypothetical protein [Planctomycetaceae bacterium]